MTLDLSGLGTVCVKCYRKRDIDLVLSALGEDSNLVLQHDLILHDTILDEGKTLSLIGQQAVTTKGDFFSELERSHHVDEHGKYTPPVQLAFCSMSEMDNCVSQVATNIKARDKERKENGQRGLNNDEEVAFEDDDDFDTKPLYYAKDKEWAVPHNTEKGDDIRQHDPSIVTGGVPRCLSGAAAEAPSTTVCRRKARRQITGYMTGEADAKGTRKVYIEQPEVVNCDSNSISVTFGASSYTVTVDAKDVILGLGPVECGPIDTATSSWRLSKGKRLTLSLATVKPVMSRDEVMAMAMKTAENPPMNIGWIIGFCLLLFMVLHYCRLRVSDAG